MQRLLTALPGLVLIPLAVLIAVLLLARPAGAQEATTIAQAQAALETARSSRAVRALAAPELDVAEEALERALAARDAGRSRSEVGHLAYLAERRAAIARMHARERQIARALKALSEAHALINEARALEAAAAERHARELAQRLTRFDVRADWQGLLLTPRAPWFVADLTLAPHARGAIDEAARMLGKLSEREVLVLGHALRFAPDVATQERDAPATAAVVQATAPRQGEEPNGIDERDRLECARADVVRAFLISHGVDPRRIAVRCDASQDASAAIGLQAGAIAIAILPVDDVPAPTIGRTLHPDPATPPLSAGVAPDEPPTTR